MISRSTRYWLYPPSGTPPRTVNGIIEGRRQRYRVVPLFTGLPTPAMRAWIAATAGREDCDEPRRG